jgi:predicted nucleic acid-binding Zn ribbon protein
MTKTCECGKEFTPTNNRQKYCGAKCSWIFHGKQHRNSLKVNYKRHCAKCGQFFYTTDVRKKFCTDECRINFFNDARDRPNKGKSGICEVCGKEYKVLRNPTKRTCSNRCAKFKCKYDGNRLKALQRDNFTCQVCGGSKNKRLNVHHKDGTGQLKMPNHDLNNLVTLCITCHHIAHKLMRSVEKNRNILNAIQH